MDVAFLLVMLERIQERRWLCIPRLAVWPVVFLLGCVSWWATQPEPPFATAFTAEHWSFMEHQFPSAILQWARGERLFFLGSLLLGFWASVDLGRSKTFRSRTGLIVAANGIAVTLYALGQRWFGLPYPFWVEIAGSTEAYDVCFFHHSGPPACLDFAWPLLVFREWQKDTVKPNIVAATVVLPILILSIPIWKSESAWAVASLLLFCGFVWLFIAHRQPINPALPLASFALLFLAAFSCQTIAVLSMRAHKADSWKNASLAAAQAPERDEQLRALIRLRGDHLVTSSAQPRPVAWLAGTRMAQDHPLIGLGPGSWVRQAVLYSNEPVMHTFYQHRQFAHHDLLQTAAEWGCLPAIAWLLLWIGGIHRASRRILTEGPNDIGLVVALVGIALHSLVHFPLQVPALQIWTAIALGLAWSRRSPARGPSQAKPA